MLPFKSLISSAQLDPDILATIFAAADDMERVVRLEGRANLLVDKIVGLVFLEPSSRTMLSFQSAAQRLHAGVLYMQGKEGSSFSKGESIEDTFRVVSGYCDLVVARLPLSGAAERAAASSSVPFINGGDGENEHPTQALIDVYTIKKKLGRLEGVHVAVGFDPKQSRAIHSLVRVLSQYKGVRFSFISPPGLRAPAELTALLTARGVAFDESDSMARIGEADVLYLNRLQEERFADKSEFERCRHTFQLTRAMLSEQVKLILDPLPRVDEIAPEVDDHPAAAYFQQAHYGIPIRMALLYKLLAR